MSQKILIPIGGKYPADAVVQSPDGSCYPMGGGFGFRLKDASLYRLVTPEDIRAVCLTPSLFSIDGGTAYAGVSNGRRWNGWECPLFTKEVAERIFQDAGLKYDYLPDTDEFRMLNEWAHPEEDPYEYAKGVTHFGVRMYPIMDGWCWDQEVPEEDAE